MSGSVVRYRVKAIRVCDAIEDRIRRGGNVLQHCRLPIPEVDYFAERVRIAKHRLERVWRKYL